MIWRRIGDRYDLLPSAVYADGLVFPVEVEARGLSVAAVEVVAVDGACPVCGTEGARLAQMGSVSACGACLTLALQAVT